MLVCFTFFTFGNKLNYIFKKGKAYLCGDLFGD
jgi:hypothetical protein